MWALGTGVFILVKMLSRFINVVECTSTFLFIAFMHLFHCSDTTIYPFIN